MATVVSTTSYKHYQIDVTEIDSTHFAYNISNPANAHNIKYLNVNTTAIDALNAAKVIIDNLDPNTAMPFISTVVGSDGTADAVIAALLSNGYTIILSEKIYKNNIELS